MTNQYGRTSSNYVVVDFSNVTEKGIKSLLDALKRGGEPVQTVEANNRKTKKDGVFVKRVKLVFENGQTIILFIAEEGDIFQLAVNGKKHPLPDAKNERELAKGLVTILRRGQEKFDKSMLKKAGKVKSTANNAPISRSLKKRAEEARKQLSDLNNQVKQFNDNLSIKQGTLSGLQSQESSLRSTLDAEKAETAQLKQQLENAKEAM
ncbi:defense against restriction DarA-related protein [Photobacterium leiognathi]|uniref:defense against restriction DarA-related protein n=1 Tax=Photobacterium leiognathi TaxID=553611 RepID=UPI00298235EB|nr:hypothetical protein [Photobacterium leiognathi]